MGEDGPVGKGPRKPARRRKARQRGIALRAARLGEPRIEASPVPRERRWTVRDVVSDLKRRIERKEEGFGPEQEMPSAIKLEVWIGASRPTVRKALAVLTEQHLIVWSGSKAFVAQTASATVVLEGPEASGRKGKKEPRDEEILDCRRWVEPEAAFRHEYIDRWQKWSAPKAAGLP